jgi:hypothetical protein
MTHTGRPQCNYIISFGILCIAAVFLFQSVAIVINFEETQNYINNTCQGVGNFTIHHRNILNNHATTTTFSRDSDLNITVYYPPVDVWIFWAKAEAREWYDQLKTLSDTNQTFPCYVDYPQNIGISHHLNNIWIYYAIATAMFIVCGGCIIYCCMEKTHTRNHEYYPLN